MTVVLVTGANSGIGTAAVAELARRGAEVVATVRSDDAERGLLDALDERDPELRQRVTVERLDVTDAAAVHDVVERRRPQVVVNNAGAALLGAVADVDDDEALEQLETMVLGPVRLARAAIDTGACRRVVQVGTIVADGAIPFTGWYAAAKAALDALIQVWRVELIPREVELVTVECGAVATDVWDRAGEQVVAGDDPTTAAARGRWAELAQVLEPRFADPDRIGSAVADAALDAHPGATVHVGFGSAVGRLVRFVPRAVRERVTSAVLGLRPS
ncbi:MAG: SDR family NAD(P)-dependent oxidoreductase [Microthrixaceae bacterium]